MGFRVWGLGFRVWGLGFRVHARLALSVSLKADRSVDQPGSLLRLSATYLGDQMTLIRRSPVPLYYEPLHGI